MTNRFQGLARGPIDKQSSSVVNVISNAQIGMGDNVKLSTVIPAAETLPRVEINDTVTTEGYGIAVGGDADGIYGDGSAPAPNDETFLATLGAGEGVAVVTQGRCLARVIGQDSAGSGAAILIGDKLTLGTTNGVLAKALITDDVIAIALKTILSGDLDIIAVDVQRSKF